MGSIQATMDAVRQKMYDITAEQVENRLVDIADYTTTISMDTVDTGAYITSFSLKPAGVGGGRSRKSSNKPRNQNPQAKKEEADEQLFSDIQVMNIPDMLEQGNMRVTLRNRAPHAKDVENGENWSKDGYHIFTRVRNNFG